MVVSDNTVIIDSTSTIHVSFSSTNELAISVSDVVADVLCGACGTIRPTLIELHTLNIGNWKAPDFPGW